MRNLKRALSLALASVMLLGMMVVGSSAKGIDDFTDKAEIVNQDAVAVTSAIGMFEGYEDGSFGPENVVTLAEMAVIACDDREAGLFRSAQWESALLCPMIDARRMEVYAEVFDTSLESRSEVAAEVVPSGSFGRFIRPEGEFFVFGSGAAKTVGVLPAEGVRFINVRPSARGLCRLAQARLDAGLVEDTAYFEPAYLKDFGDGRPEKIVLRK